MTHTLAMHLSILGNYDRIVSKERERSIAMKEECLICKAPLEYLETSQPMECAICHKVEDSRTRYVNGHYVCDACHTRGLDSIFGVCLAETSKNPYEILVKLMDLPFCHMHGPEHHVMVGASLLTAYKNAGGDIDLPAALTEMQARGRKVPGGACGFCGSCGAAVSAGMYMAIVTKSTPLTDRAWGLSNSMTGQILTALGDLGGPRCCKRNSFEALRKAVAFTREHLEVDMELGYMPCKYSGQNNQCHKIVCPYNKRNQ